MNQHINAEIIESLSDIACHLENINSNISLNHQNVFFIQVAHILTCDIFDSDKLNCIRIAYKMMAWPEKDLNDIERRLMEKIK